MLPHEELMRLSAERARVEGQDRWYKTVPVVIEHKSLPREHALGLVGPFEHRDVKHRAMTMDKGEERGAAVGGVGYDTFGAVAEPPATCHWLQR